MITSLGSKEAGTICAIAAVVLYLNTLDCELVYDDENAISWNPDLRSSTPWSRLFFHDFWGSSLSNPISHKSYRPLCVASFRLNYMLHGLDAMGYHLVNVVLHAAVCYLYVQLCAVIFNTTTILPALVAGLLFATHPIHTEAVTGVVGRAELLSAIFFLSSFLLYQKSVAAEAQGGTCWLVLGVSLLLSLCAMLSKEQGITVLAFSLTYDLFLLNKLNFRFLARNSKMFSSALATNSLKTKKFIVRGVVVLGVALIFLLIRLVVSNGAPVGKAFATSANPPLGQKMPYRQLSWLHLVFINTKLLFIPSHLSADWRYGAVQLIESIWDWNNVLTGVTLGLIAGLSVYCLTHQDNDHRRIILMGVCLMTFPFLPASNLFFPVGFVVAERVLYVPSMGFCLLVSYGFWMMLGRWQACSWLIKSMLGCILLVYGMKTMSRNRDWLSATTINKAGVIFNPLHAIMLSNLGIEFSMQEDYRRAEILYRTSMHSYPLFSGGFYNYGILMNILHRYKEAEEPLWKAIELGTSDTPKSRMAERYNLLVSVISMNSSRLLEAQKLNNYVLTQHPHYTRSFETKCSILLKLNHTRQMIHACEEALWNNQNLPSAYCNLGMAYMKLGHLSHAEVTFRNMLSLDGSNVLGMTHLAGILQTTGKTEHVLEAKQLWIRVLIQNPNSTDALLSLSHVDIRLNHYAEALDSLHRVLQVNPHHQDALYKAGQLHFKNRDDEQASELVTRLLNLDSHYSGAAALLRSIKERIPHNTS